MDLDDFFRTKVESMLITASWVEKVQKMLDLGGISQVWDDRPEWYIWIEGASGVYALVFEGGKTINAADHSLHLGQFAVKCFPYITADVFNTFSSAEREVVTGDLFDHTHTPRLESRIEIPEAFFAIGSITLTLDAAETVALFTFESLDFLRWSALTTKTASENCLPEKRLIRNIPGWQVGYPLFDRLISLYAFYSRQPPTFIGATRSPGFECIIDMGQAPENWACDDTQQWSTSVLFTNPGATDPLVDNIWRAQLDAEEQITFEHACAHSVCDHSAGNGIPPVDINSLWWDLAHANLKSELASICGCEHYEHHGSEATICNIKVGIT